MKKLYRGLLLFIVLSCCCLRARPQTAPDSILLEKFLLDFTVPDMPAFKALGTDPSDLLRASDAKKFAALVSPFYSNGKGVIPRNFAFEAAPWKIASKKWTLYDFRTSFFRRFLYRSSFSLGTVSDTTAFPSKLGIGYRVSFLSKRADVYRSAEVDAFVFNNQVKVMVAFTALTNHWVNNIVKPPLDERPTYYQTHKEEFQAFIQNIKVYLKEHPDPALESAFNTYAESLASLSNGEFNPEEIKDVIVEYANRVDAYIEKYKQDNWNASRTDVALAWVGESRDSLISNAQFSSFSVWLTQALAIHKNGQLLLGAHLSLPRSEGQDSTKLDFSGNLRYYLGTKDFRGFIEAQYKYRKQEVLDKSLLFNLGAELRIGSNWWVVAGAGINNYLGLTDPLSKIVSSIDLRYGLNSR